MMGFDSDFVEKDSNREEYNRQQKGKEEQKEEIDNTSALVNCIKNPKEKKNLLMLKKKTT